MRRAFWELLLGAFVRLADLQRIATECQTFLCLLGEILVVGLRLVFRFCRGRFFIHNVALGAWAIGEGWIAGTRVRSEARLVLGFGLRNLFASFLVIPLGVAILLLAPSMRRLLLMVTTYC